ncbi:MAG: GNAT family N-acetyltransferase [Bacilli bacterium]|nr:GNAT family N-acetyltransferase [Bacilli bacterium]
MKYFKKIVGERLYLSPMNVEDAETYVKWMSDRSVTDNLGNTRSVCTLPGEKEYIESRKSSDYDFSIVLNDDTLIGNISLMDVNLVSRKATLGIFIGDEENRSKGYGTEAMKLLVDYGFNILGLHNIDLNVFAFNERAIKSYEKVGFKEYGRRHESYFLDGKYHDEICMEIINKGE